MRYVGDGIRPFHLSKDRSEYVVPIPAYHRAAVGLFPGTKLYATPVPSRNEMIITSIAPDNWGDIWRIDLNLKDLPGAVESVIKTLHENKINILVEESMSHVASNKQKAHALLLIVDLARYDNHFDGDTDNRNHVKKPNYHPSFLINSIISKSVQFLHKTPGESGWDISVGRLDYFFNIKENRENYQTTYLHQNTIAIKCKEVTDSFYQGDNSKVPMGFITSDTEEKCLKINFVNDSRRYLMLELYHKEEHGAILQVMEKIREQNVNIIASYTRLFNMDRESVWYGILEFQLNFDEQELLKLLTAIDSLSMIRERFSIIGQYNWPFDFDDAEKRWGLANLKPRRKPAERKLPVQSAQNIEHPIPDNLVTHPYYEGKGWKHEGSSVFVALQFDKTGDSMYRKVYSEVVHGMDLRPYRVDQIQTAKDEPIIDVIMRKIATCEFMIADVSDQNPNVMYEVALAHAIGKQVILCSRLPDNSQPQLAFDIRHKAHLFYDMLTIDDFRIKLSAKIDAIINQKDIVVPFG
jgi:hypothetical protein